MITVSTKLTTSGNSKAVRLPATLLKMSGLGKNVELEARRGQIIIRNSKNPREGWQEQIEKLVAEYGDPGDEFKDWRKADFTEWDDLPPWDGPTYEEWLKQNAKTKD